LIILPSVDECFVVVAPASDAQARIWIDEQSRFHFDKSKLTIYNMPFFYRLSSGHTLSIKQLYQTLQKIVIKHQSLRTSLTFHIAKTRLMQRVIDLNNNNNQLFAFIENTFDTDEQLNNIMLDERQNFQHFDLVQGLVFRCHLVYYKKISSNDLLFDKDILIFNFHHALFDLSSMDVFLHDLNQAYRTGELTTDNDVVLRYVDCKYQKSIFHHFQYRHFSFYLI
jgi:Condensation domain